MEASIVVQTFSFFYNFVFYKQTAQINILIHY